MRTLSFLTMLMLLVPAMLCLPVPAVEAGATAWNIAAKPTADWWTGNTKDIAWRWAKEIDALSAAGARLGTGNIYYVDSNVASEGDGSDWANAKDTLDEAINLCTAGNGDVIFVAQGHAEDIIADGTVDVDVAGITIIGLGYGDSRPQFTCKTAATADLNVDADDVYLYNLIFLSGKSDLAACITVTNDDCTIDSCSFRDSTAGLGMIAVGAADGDSDRLTIVNCDFYQPGNTNDHAIEILYDMVGVRIVNNVFHGDYDEGVIAIPAGGNACLDLVIADNVITQLQASVFAILINGTSTTGVITRNSVNATANYECDPGACVELLNSWQMDIDLVTNNLDHAAKVTTGVAADGDLSSHVVDQTILSHIMTAGADTSDYQASTDSLEAIANALAAGTGCTAAIEADNLDHVAKADTTVAADADLTTYVADGSILSHIMTAGADTSDFQASTDSLEAISGLVVTADAVIDSVYAVQEKAVIKTLTTITNGNNNLFTVANGPIKIVEIVAYVTSAIEAKSCLINYNIDPTNPATDTVFATDGTALEINADAIGTLYTWNGVIGTDLTATTNGVALGNAAYSGLICPTGSIELAAVVDASATGTIVFYMRYLPLSPSSTVTAQ